MDDHTLIWKAQSHRLPKGREDLTRDLGRCCLGRWVCLFFSVGRLGTFKKIASEKKTVKPSHFTFFRAQADHQFFFPSSGFAIMT